MGDSKFESDVVTIDFPMLVGLFGAENVEAKLLPAVPVQPLPAYVTD
jgi:hypothetical protein